MSSSGIRHREYGIGACAGLASGRRLELWGTTGASADLDKNGRLDLCVTNDVEMGKDATASAARVRRCGSTVIRSFSIAERRARQRVKLELHRRHRPRGGTPSRDRRARTHVKELTAVWSYLSQRDARVHMRTYRSWRRRRRRSAGDSLAKWPVGDPSVELCLESALPTADS